MTRRARGEGTVLRDGDSWIARIDLPPGPDGKRRRVKRRARTKTEAHAKLKKLQEKYSAVENPDGLRRTVGEAVETYLDSRSTDGVAEKTVVGWRWRGDVIVAGLGAVEIGKLSVRQCDTFLERAANGDFGQRTMAPETVRRVRSLLRAVLRNEMRLGNVGKNVADLADLPKARFGKSSYTNEDGDTSSSLRRTLSYADYRKLWEAATWPLLVVVDLCGRNGLRPSEARALGWRSINLDDQTLTVDRQMTSGTKFTPPKTRGSLRTIPIDDTTVDILKTWKELQNEKMLRAGERWQPVGVVFSTGIGTPVNASNLRRMLSAACERAGLDSFVPYELRHTAITFQCDQGIEDWEIADWAGTSVPMIQQIYRHRLHRVSRVRAVQVDGVGSSAMGPITGSQIV